MEQGSEWSEQTETILQILSDQCFLSSKVHERLYRVYSCRLKYIKIPVIVISGLNSVLAVGLGDYIDQNIISASTSVLSLICGILGSIELFLKISENMARSSSAARELFVLHIEIRKTLKLESQDRGIDAKTYLDNVYTRYIDIITNAKLVIRDKNEHTFSAPPEAPVTSENTQGKLQRFVNTIRRLSPKTRSVIHTTQQPPRQTIEQTPSGVQQHTTDEDEGGEVTLDNIKINVE